MFLGEYERSLDAKGRIVIPTEYREGLGENPVISKALGGCLAIYPNEVFAEVAARAREIAKRGPRERIAAAALASGAVQVTPDKQGRVAIPPNLRRFAELGREIVIVGNFFRVDVWNVEKNRDRDREADRSIVEAPEVLSEIGM